MKNKVLNKILGTLVIVANLIIYFPWTWEIIQSKGGGEGWGFLFLPLTLCFHLFVVTGIFGWLSTDKMNRRPIKVTLLAILCLLGLLTIINIGWATTAFLILLIIGFFSLVGLTIHKKLKVEQTLLITNAVGFSLMITVKILLDL